MGWGMDGSVYTTSSYPLTTASSSDGTSEDSPVIYETLIYSTNCVKQMQRYKDRNSTTAV